MPVMKLNHKHKSLAAKLALLLGGALISTGCFGPGHRGGPPPGPAGAPPPHAGPPAPGPAQPGPHVTVTVSPEKPPGPSGPSAPPR